MTLILIDENVVDPSKQAIKIQIAVGTEGLQRLNASTLTDEDKKDPAKIYKLFDDQLDIKVNFRIHRMELMAFRQNENETTDEFVNRARHKGSLCDFGEPDADGGDYTESFYVITAAQKSRTTATRHEVYANLDIVCADKPGVHDLELKVDTG